MSDIKPFNFVPEEISKTKKSLETASLRQLIELFDYVAKDDLRVSDNPNDLYCHTRYTLQNDENGNLKVMVAGMDDGRALAIIKTGNGFSVMKGKRKELGNDLFTITGADDICECDRNANLLKRTTYEPDDSYQVQKFEDGKLKFTSFYDKDNNLIKRVNKKGALNAAQLRMPWTR